MEAEQFFHLYLPSKITSKTINLFIGHVCPHQFTLAKVLFLNPKFHSDIGFWEFKTQVQDHVLFVLYGCITFTFGYKCRASCIYFALNKDTYLMSNLKGQTFKAGCLMRKNNLDQMQQQVPNMYKMCLEKIFLQIKYGSLMSRRTKKNHSQLDGCFRKRKQSCLLPYVTGWNQIFL